MCLPCASQNLDLAGSSFQQAFQDLDRCSFARAIRTEQAKAFAGLDGQVKTAYGFYFAFIGLAEIPTLDRYSHPIMINGLKKVGVRAWKVVGSAIGTDCNTIRGMGGARLQACSSRGDVEDRALAPEVTRRTMPTSAAETETSRDQPVYTPEGVLHPLKADTK